MRIEMRFRFLYILCVNLIPDAHVMCTIQVHRPTDVSLILIKLRPKNHLPRIVRNPKRLSKRFDTIERMKEKPKSTVKNSNKMEKQMFEFDAITQ